MSKILLVFLLVCTFHITMGQRRQSRLQPLPRLVYLSVGPHVQHVRCIVVQNLDLLGFVVPCSDGLPSQVSEARAPQSQISRWQFPRPYAINMGIWRRIGTTANSPDADELAVVPFLAVHSEFRPPAWGNCPTASTTMIL